MEGYNRSDQPPEHEKTSKEDDIIELTNILQTPEDEENVLELTDIVAKAPASDPFTGRAGVQGEESSDEAVLDLGKVATIRPSQPNKDEVTALDRTASTPESAGTFDPDVPISETDAIELETIVEEAPYEPVNDVVEPETTMMIDPESTDHDGIKYDLDGDLDKEKLYPPDDAGLADAMGIKLDDDLQLSQDQLEEALERVIEKVYKEKIEALMISAIEKTVAKEIQKIKDTLSDDVDDKN